jgi:hypothetical protein
LGPFFFFCVCVAVYVAWRRREEGRRDEYATFQLRPQLHTDTQTQKTSRVIEIKAEPGTPHRVAAPVRLRPLRTLLYFSWSVVGFGGYSSKAKKGKKENTRKKHSHKEKGSQRAKLSRCAVVFVCACKCAVASLLL